MRWTSALWRWGMLLTGIADSQPWRLLSAMFVHLGILHLALNMMSFVDLGRMTEARVGSWRCGVIFVVTGVLGFVTSELWYGLVAEHVPTAGASGGLFGLGGALVGCLYARRDPAYKDLLLRMVVYAVVFALLMPVNNSAHAGGLVSGARPRFRPGEAEAPPASRSAVRGLRRGADAAERRQHRPVGALRRQGRGVVVVAPGEHGPRAAAALSG